MARRPSSTSASCQLMGSRPRGLVVPRVPVENGPSSVTDSTEGSRSQLSTLLQNRQANSRLAGQTTECSNVHDINLIPEWSALANGAKR